MGSDELIGEMGNCEGNSSLSAIMMKTVTMHASSILRLYCVPPGRPADIPAGQSQEKTDRERNVSSRGEEMEPGGDRKQMGVHSDAALKEWAQSSWNRDKDALIQESDLRSAT